MTGAIILAAGTSSRLGQPKQNLLFRGETLLKRSINTALRANCRPVIVVLGANANLIDNSNKYDGIKTIYNPDWKEGMASSIRLSVKEIQDDSRINNIIIMLCDQPFVNPALINDIIQKQQETGKPVVACTYKNTIGVPVLFNRALFAELLLLQGQEGAKKIISGYKDNIVKIAFEDGSIDIDTIEDYEQLLKSSG